jgi:RNA-binding protein
MKVLTAKQKRYLRGLAHSRKPVVIIGNAGLTESVLEEIDNSITVHELIKVKVNAPDRQARSEMIQAISRHTGATLVFAIGHMATFYRRSDKRLIELPK